MCPPWQSWRRSTVNRSRTSSGSTLQKSPLTIRTACSLVPTIWSRRSVVVRRLPSMPSSPATTPNWSIRRVYENSCSLCLSMFSASPSCMCGANTCALAAASCSDHQDPCYWPSERPSHAQAAQAAFLARGARDRPSLPGGKDRPVVFHQQRQRGLLSPQCVDGGRSSLPAGSVAFGKAQADGLPTNSAGATQPLGPYAAPSITTSTTQGDETSCCQRKHRTFSLRR